MDLNFLQKLGVLSSGAPAPGPLDAMGSIVAPPPQPTNVLAGIPAPIAQPTAAPINALQALNGGNANAAPAPELPAAPATAAPRARRSILDTVGRLADVFAKVGGADALYQPTLDAREDRSLMLGDHAQTVDLNKLKIQAAGQGVEENAGELTDKGNVRLGQAVRGVQAILAANPGADVSTIFPMLAQQAGVPADRAANLAAQLKENPGLLAGLAGTVGAGKEFGLQPFYAKDANGQLAAYQLGKDGSVQQVALPNGTAPIDPLKFVDVGGSQVGVGTRSGNATRILPKTEAPGKAADRASRETIAAGGNASRERIASMPARGKGAAGGATAPAGGNMAKVALGNLDELEKIYDDLDKSKGIVSTKRSGEQNILSSLGSSSVGQVVGGAVGSKTQALRDRIGSIRPQLMQSIAKATGMTGKQLDSNADVKLFMQTVTDPTKSYEANKAAIGGLRRFIANNQPAAAPAAKAVPRAAAPGRRPAAGKPSVSNW